MGNAITEIRFTKADHLENIFIDLGGITNDDPDTMLELWLSIQEVQANPTTDDSNLMADQWCGDGRTDEKYVSVATVEKYIRRPLQDAEAEGRAEVAKCEEMISKRYK